ncbi:hypothetical protein B0J14DRAFT_616486 [Halenospora varia]|nr:hypothetical protein B0J14DRAFT_616486 [Halenospora varia]
MFHAFGSVGSNIPTLNDIQTGKFSQEGWSGPGQRRNSLAHRETDVEVLEVRRQRTMSIAQSPKVPIISEKKEPESSVEVASTQIEMSSVIAPHDPNIPYANGYQFPPKHTKKQAFKIAMKGSWNFVTTPFGFLLTIYALNIVAWGGMLFLILIHATPAMAHPSYNDDYSGAKIWLEITAQILNALFCVTGLGLIPWRFRDLYYLLVWRLQKKEEGLRHLAGIHRNWFRLKGSQEIDIHFDPSASSAILPEGLNESALALPISLSPDAPLTGERASASKYWMMDFVVWMFVWNTFLQIILCGFMWGYNRFKRPGAAVGALISLACIVASAAGYLVFREGKRVKKVEGVPVSEEDMKILREMREKEGASV